MVACRADCSAGSATFTTVPSMNAMLEPRMVAARIQEPFVVAGRSHEPARIAASSQGGLAMLAIVHSPLGGLVRFCESPTGVSTPNLAKFDGHGTKGGRRFDPLGAVDTDSRPGPSVICRCHNPMLAGSMS